MKKNNRVLRIGLLALVLTLVTASLVSGTFAKYVTTVSGTGTVTVAKWNAVLTGPFSSVNNEKKFDFFKNYTSGDGAAETGVKGVQLAPGTKGSFNFTYNTTGTEVAHNVKINLHQTSGTPLSDINNLKFTIAGGTATELTSTNIVKGVDIVDAIFAPGSNGTTEDKTVTVNWEWPFTPTDDEQDTIDGETPIKNAIIAATFTATQLDTYTSQP